MSSDKKPIINHPPCSIMKMEDPLLPKSEALSISQSSSIPQILSFLKSTFLDEDFSFVQQILLGRENSLKLELQKLNTNVELLQKKQALRDLEKLKIEDQLKDSLEKCDKLRENVAQLGEEKRVLCDKNFKVEERYKKIIEDLVKDLLKDSLNECEKLRENVATLEEEKRVLCDKNLKVEERYKKIIDDLAKDQEEKTQVLFDRIEELKKEKCEVEETLRIYEVKFDELNGRVSCLEEEVGKIKNLDVCSIRNMAIAETDRGSASHKNLESEVNLKSENLESSQGKDGVIDSPHGAKSVCNSTGNSTGKSRNKGLLPINLARENGNPIRNSLACKAGDCLNNNLNVVSDKPGSSPVILIIDDDDDDDEMACASKSSGLAGNLTSPQVCTKDSSNLMPKRKRSVSESENNDISSFGRQKTVPIQELVNDGKRSVVGDSSSNAEHSSIITRVIPSPEQNSEFIRRCEDKIGKKNHSQLTPRRSDKPNVVGNDNDSDSDNDSCGTKNLDRYIASIRESRKWLSEADLCSAFEIDPELCMYAVCALYRRQISENDSSKDFSYSGSQIDEESIAFLGKYLTDREHKLRRTASEVKPYHDMCKGIAIRHCRQLYQLYHSKEDHLFCPGTVFSKL